MNTLTIIEPEFVEVKDRDNSYYSSRDKIILRKTSMLPYSNTYWKDAIERFGIRIPSVLVTLADGKTTCPLCKSVYSGRQFICDNQVGWFEYKSGYSTSTERGNPHVGDIHETSYGLYKVEKSYTATCMNTSLEWTHRNEFDFQSDFFNLLSQLSSVSSSDTSILARFAEFIPYGKYDLIESNLMRIRVEQLEMQQGAIIGAIKQIADRMSQAGNALNIGNF